MTYKFDFDLLHTSHSLTVQDGFLPSLVCCTWRGQGMISSTVGDVALKCMGKDFNSKHVFK